MAILLDADRAEQLKAGAAPAVAAEETGKRKPPETKPNKPFNASRFGLYIDSKRFNIKAEFPSRYFTSSPKKPKLSFICFSLLNYFKVFKVFNLCGMDVYQKGLANTARVSPGLVGTPFYNPMNVSIHIFDLPPRNSGAFPRFHASCSRTKSPPPYARRFGVSEKSSQLLLTSVCDSRGCRFAVRGMYRWGFALKAI
ncbi:hypothetical protein C8R43DRAFT_1119098 [Mycena crocata]|nr:hypothetical protein C8R43DRAFT_1119098 [Mycena crocata]